MDGHTAKTSDLAGETRLVNEQGTEKQRRDRFMDQMEKTQKKDYLKEATVTVNTSNANIKAEDIIKAVTEKIGMGKILAVRPKLNKEYEVTLENVKDVELLEDGLMIKEMNCEIKRLQNREYVVSFMHLPVYIDDNEILNKLKGWGVTPITGIKRRVYPGTIIEDGTRYVKSRFPKEIMSLPYSTKFDTEEGLQYFRVMHSHQMKICRMCMSPEHMIKDCPEFKCHKCEERGHFSRDCNAVKCLDCRRILNKCQCWNNEETNVNGQVHERHNNEDEVAENGTTEERNKGKGEKTVTEEQIEKTISTKDQVQPNTKGEKMDKEIGVQQQENTTEGEQTEEVTEQGNKETQIDKEEGIATQSNNVENLEWDMDKVKIKCGETMEKDSQMEVEITGAEGDGQLKTDDDEETESEEQKMDSSDRGPRENIRRRKMKVKPNLKCARKKTKGNIIGVLRGLERENDI